MLILEAADLRTQLSYNVFPLLTVYLENRGPFTAHSKTPSSSPDFQIQCRGAWQEARVNKYQLLKGLDSRLDPVPNFHAFESVHPTSSCTIFFFARPCFAKIISHLF